MTLMVQVEYDKKADALYIQLRKATADISAEASPNVIIDLDKAGRIIGIEVLDASKNMGQELVTKIINTEKLEATAYKRSKSPLTTLACFRVHHPTAYP